MQANGVLVADGAVAVGTAVAPEPPKRTSWWDISSAISYVVAKVRLRFVACPQAPVCAGYLEMWETEAFFTAHRQFRFSFMSAPVFYRFDEHVMVFYRLKKFSRSRSRKWRPRLTLPDGIWPSLPKL